MGKPKNKNFQKSKNFSKPKKYQKSDFSLAAKKIITAVIIIAMISVILFLLFKAFSTPERVIKTKIEAVAADYYENFLYPDIEKYGTREKTLSEIMHRYEQNGFSEVTLRQLSLYDGKDHADVDSIINTYCDDTASYVKFYPEPPYGQKDYRIDYHYTCEF